MKKIAIEECNNRIKERFPEEQFKIIEFDGLGKPGKIQCLNCNKIIEINKFSNFFAKNKRYGCKNCNGLWRDREVKLNAIKEKYDILNSYVKENHTYYRIKCKSCGHERESTLNNLFRHLECGCKTNVYRNRTDEEFINECNKYYNNELELVGEYKNQTTKVLLRHKPCNFIWSVRPSDIIHGKSHCPKCRTQQSVGASRIENHLKELNIKYFVEYPLKNSKQRFDFFLPEYDIAFEYNGKQHYEYNEFFHKNQAGFQKYQERDLKKKQYCIDNNIKLISIPYTADDIIEKIIDDTISSTTKVRQVPENATPPI